jgi:16S rRNA (guanine1207-N2)-methyltransferase
VSDGQRVLDCSCGYGAVGAFIGARTDCELWATDDDVVATTYAEKNYERNGVTPHTVVTDDAFDSIPDDHFDAILMNPPTHAGKGITTKLFSGAYDALTDGGVLYVVANTIMHYDVRLADRFDFETTIIATDKNYDVIRAERARTD